MLKRLYEEYDLSIERILIKEYKRLGLTMQEMQVLLALFSIYKKRKTFSITAIAKRVEYNSNDIGVQIESLLNKGFMTINLESKDQREREIFDLDPTFKKVFDLFKKYETEKVKQQEESNVALTIRRFEQGLGRLLMPFELENIRVWYEDKAFTHEQILNAIETAKEKLSVKYVERILNQTIPKEIEIDDEVNQALDEVFKKMK
ncbi:MAG: DnaD domain protein [Acholeplasmataceae bacterium]|nr:DnaD domain protein [Acholeplasmataceae bacterium]